MSHWPGWIEASIEAVPTDRENSAPVSDMPSKLFKLWFILARFADKSGIAWPSLATLSLKTGWNRSHLTRTLAEGERRGLWTRERPPAGSRATTRYRIHRIPTRCDKATSGDKATRCQSAHRLGAKAQHRTNPKNKAISSKADSNPHGPLWDAVVRAFKLNPVTRSERSRVGRIVRDLVAKGADPGDVERRLMRYRNAWPKAADTPEALLKHWDRFAEPVGIFDVDPVEPPAEVFDD